MTCQSATSCQKNGIVFERTRTDFMILYIRWPPSASGSAGALYTPLLISNQPDGFTVILAISHSYDLGKALQLTQLPICYCIRILLLLYRLRILSSYCGYIRNCKVVFTGCTSVLFGTSLLLTLL